MIDNSIDHLDPGLARVFTLAITNYVAAHPGGLRPRLGETSRLPAVQAAYFAQGRRPLVEINRLRNIAHLAPIGSVEGGRKITNAQPGQSAHNFLPSRAFDVQMARPDGSIDWSDAPYIVFAGFVKQAAAQLGVAVSQGAHWPKFQDNPHCELKLWRTMH